jgi:hypothetical protein
MFFAWAEKVRRGREVRMWIKAQSSNIERCNDEKGASDGVVEQGEGKWNGAKAETQSRSFRGARNNKVTSLILGAGFIVA